MSQVAKKLGFTYGVTSHLITNQVIQGKLVKTKVLGNEKGGNKDLFFYERNNKSGLFVLRPDQFTSQITFC